jgi:hypothetical protein
MKTQITVITILLLAMNLYGQIHTESSDYFALVSVNYTDSSETHTINATGENYLKITADVWAVDWGTALIQIMSSFGTQYGLIEANPMELGEVEDAHFEIIIPNNCKIELTVACIATTEISYEVCDEPFRVEYVYDDAGNRIERMVVSLVTGLKKSLVSNAQMREQIEQNIEDDFEPSRKFNVYPNPTTQHVFVSLNEEALECEDKKILIFDSLGKQVLSNEVYDEIVQIDMSSLQNGMYILKLIYGNRSKECKIIKR